MKQKTSVPYRIEREFLSKYTAKEMLARIIESHIKKEEKAAK